MLRTKALRTSPEFESVAGQYRLACPLSQGCIAPEHGAFTWVTNMGNIIPSSRSLLAGEQADTCALLRAHDRKSRHRRIKKQRRYERLAATSQLSLW